MRLLTIRQQIRHSLQELRETKILIYKKSAWLYFEERMQRDNLYIDKNSILSTFLRIPNDPTLCTYQQTLFKCYLHFFIRQFNSEEAFVLLIRSC